MEMGKHTKFTERIMARMVVVAAGEHQCSGSMVRL